MNGSQNPIEHKGIIDNIDCDKIYVRILSQSACASCHARGSCPVSKLKEKIIEINKTKSNNYKIGEAVKVTMAKSLGTKAVLLAYFFPFIVLLLSLIILINFTGNQGLSGLISIGLLIPYYLILYFYRNKIKKTFKFQIKND